MSAVRVMVAFAAGATIAGMVVGVARLTDVIEPATAVADGQAGKPAPTPPRIAAGALEAVRPARSAAVAESRGAGGGAEPRDAPVAERGRTASEPQVKKKAPPRWRAPDGAPEEVTAGVLARVASRRAQASRCEPARASAAAEPPARNPAKPAAPEATSCPPAEGTASIEIEWNGSSATR